MLMGVRIITKLQRNREKTIEDLTKAAYSVFSEKGYEKATVDDIAFAAGYTKGAFYWYFSSKEDLFLKIIDYRIEAQQRAFMDYFNLAKDLTTNVQDVFEGMVHFTSKDNWTPLFIEFLAQASRNQKVKEKMASMYNNWRSFLDTALKTLQEAGHIPKQVNIKFTSALIIAIFDGFNMQNLVEPELIDYRQIGNFLTVVIGSAETNYF